MFKVFKRCFDVCSASLLLIAISPLFLLLFISVRIKLGSPAFFCQIRSGKNRRPFKIIKFRTMTNKMDGKGNLLPDEQRFTKFGQWLRSTSLDELPELINIIKGDMSVIGPRPLPPIYDNYYSEREMKRFQVRSGLVSPESIDTDPFISWDKQLEYDAKYVENLSLKEDCRILYLVFRMLFYRYDKDLGGWNRESLNKERNNLNNEKHISNCTSC